VTTSAPQWPGQEDVHERRSGGRDPSAPTALRAASDGSARRPQPLPEAGRRVLQPVPGPTAPRQRPRRAAARRERLVVAPDPLERDLVAKRRRARATLPSPVAVTRDLALALLEVEAGCRSAGQLERIFSPELWEALEHRIGRRGGPLPSGRSLISVVCQEHTPGLADTVAVVQLNQMPGMRVLLAEPRP
jgi:uncharacterized protein DUF6459